MKLGACNNNTESDRIFNGIYETCNFGLKTGSLPYYCVVDHLPEGFSWCAEDPGFSLTSNLTYVGFTLPPGFTLDDFDNSWLPRPCPEACKSFCKTSTPPLEESSRIASRGTCKDGLRKGSLPDFCVYNSLREGFRWSSKNPRFVLHPGLPLHFEFRPRLYFATQLHSQRLR